MGPRYNWQNFNLIDFAKKHRAVACYKDGIMVGLMLSVLLRSTFDSNKIVLRQEFLYTTKPKATWLLMKDFIDFGKRYADHIITMTWSETNIKEESLKRLGFNVLETQYIMEN